MNGSPQVEDGFLRLATELQRALCRTRIPGEARQVLDAIFLKTYGFNKTEDAISLSQLSDLTGLLTSDVCRALKKLLAMNIISKKASRGMNVWRVNKHYGEWRVLAKRPVAKKLLAKKTKGTGENANQVLAKTPDTIDTSTKDILQKTVDTNVSTVRKGPHPGVERIMKCMIDCFGELDDSIAKNRQYAWQLFRQASKGSAGDDDRAAAACESLIRSASKHAFWGSKITKVEHIYRNSHRIANDLRKPGGSKSAVFIS